ncbi:MAG: cob(I)yrinic acid a,c-diamide adenosyltransferase [Actinomycetota bacterium]|nr:cob(I)yrinic acid a,c-diamide adenosyltransferase [Actinomycetota bacterium]
MSRKREEPVRLTRIYTRGGDSGETSLGDGSRVPKTDPLIAAYGSVDELNSVLGVVLSVGVPDEMRPPLERIQNELFDLGADLSVPFAGEALAEEGARRRTRVTQQQIDELERLCDGFNAELPELRSFVLPGGSEAASLLHVARSVARRAERAALVAGESRGVNPLALAYLNRLSDLLFILARAANAGGEEPLWRPGASS